MLIPRPIPTSNPPRPNRKRTLAALTTLGLAGLIAGLLSGCSTAMSPVINTSTSTPAVAAFAAAAGNWKFTSAHTAFAGSLAISGNTVSGTLHPLLTLCGTSAEPFSISGTIASSRLLTMTSANFSDGEITISGTLAADEHSLLNPTLNVTGGTCTAAAAIRSGNPSAHLTPTATAQQYQAVTGNYNGTFTDGSGAILTVTATLSQPTSPDANGVYHLTGYATFPNTACLDTPVITDSTVTGDSIQTTYTDKQTGNTVSATGTFSADAQTLTIANWTLSGCGDDTGTGTLSRPAN